MPGLLTTAYKFTRLRGRRSLFDRAYLVQFELSEMSRPAAFGSDTKDWDDASPIEHVRADAPPFLVISAEDDAKLEEEAEELAARLRAAGAKADTLIIPGTDHFTILGFVGNRDDTLIEQMISFVKRNQKQEPEVRSQKPE